MTGPRPSLDEIVATTDRPSLDEIVAADPLGKLHADYRSGALAKRVKRENVSEAERLAAEPGALETLGQVPETLAAGLPGGKLLISGGRKLLNPRQPFAEIQADVNRETSDVPYASAVGRVAGALPAAALAGPLGLVKGGMAFGAAEGLLGNEPDTSPTGRVGNAAWGAGVGALTGGALKGAGRIATKAGLTDLLSRGVDKIAPNLSARIGTPGQVNKALMAEEELLAPVGGGGTGAGGQALARADAKIAQAAKDYGLARQDTRALEDPRLTQLMADPRVQPVFEAVAKLRETAGTPLPRVETPAEVPMALRKMGVSPERWKELNSPEFIASRKAQGINPVTRTGVDILPDELKGAEKGVELPDPAALHLVKRILYKVASGGKDSRLPLSQEQAAALTPVVDEVRATLHSVSPAWKTADVNYADAMGQQQGFQRGLDLFTKAKAPSGKAVLRESTESVQRWLTTPLNASESAEAMASRTAAFREGAKAAVVRAGRNVPLDKGLRSLLSTKPLTPSPNTQALRSLMFQSPKESAAFENRLATARGEAMSTPATSRYVEPPVGKYHAIRAGMRGLIGEPDLLATPRGQQMVAAAQASPALRASQKAAFTKGQSLLDFLRTAAIAGQAP
jgi:hypothetical protein